MYKPHRNELFEYAADAVTYVEEVQCSTCKFREAMDEFFMCWEAQSNILFELPVEFMYENPDQTITCIKYEEGNPDATTA